MIPWSWLVDWFSNTGDILENLDAGVAERLAADYAYVMREYQLTVEQYVSATFKTMGGGTIDVNLQSQSFKFSKYRTPISPFGWNVKESDLSMTQLSILGALGLSRL